MSTSKSEYVFSVHAFLSNYVTLLRHNYKCVCSAYRTVVYFMVKGFHSRDYTVSAYKLFWELLEI